MGRAVALDLARGEGVETVTLADSDVAMARDA